ncbi:carboxylesterase family protein [Orbaceae bacterium ESL0727]|nr:carboxylesterase family protein [Orbaceae bacterium ESL0727]
MRLKKIAASLVILLSCQAYMNYAYAANRSYAANNTHANELLVHTQSGTVQGKNISGVMAWTGIPYAAAPIGQLRWRAPEPAAKWQNTFDATQPAAECIQPTATGSKGVEDCLNVNIYAPHSKNKKLPVLIYIHGGNNQTGSSTEFSPLALTKDIDAIVVTFNYRLGSLGFNPLKALNTGDPVVDSGNFSLLDMRALLDWVHNNIAAFGGDPQNITLSGFSAGGRDTMAMLISPLFKDKFQKAIIFSGGMTTMDRKEAENIFADRIANLVVKNGIKADKDEAKSWLLSDKKEVRDFLYGLPAADLAMLFGDAGIRMEKFPHLYRDGRVLPLNGFETKKYNAVPVMMVTGQSEFSFFARSDPLFASAIANNKLTTDTNLLNKYNFSNQYGGQLYSLFNVELSAEKMYPHYSAPIYGVEFRYGMDSYVTGKRLAQIGAFHGIFMPFLDSQKYSDFTADIVKTKPFVDIKSQFNAYLANFIHQGNPNGKDLVAWKTWSPANAQSGQSLLTIDANKSKALIYMSSKNYTYHDVMTAIADDNSLSAEDKSDVLKHVLNGRWFSNELDQKFSQ